MPESTYTKQEAGTVSNSSSTDLLACPHCGSPAKLQSSLTVAWVCCSNHNDPCPSYDTEWSGIQPMRVGGAITEQQAADAWNEKVKSIIG